MRITSGIPIAFFSVLLSAGIVAASGPGALPEVENLLFDGTKTNYTWDPAPGAATYNVYRGDIGSYVPNWGNCFHQNLGTESDQDLTGNPPPGTGYFYLITAAANGTPEGTKGDEDFTPGERANPAPCPSLPIPPLYLDRIHPNGPVGPDGVEQGVNAPINPGIANDLNGLAGGGMYLHTGEYFLEEVDLEVPGRGLTWRHVRYYRSQINHDGQVGWNWTFNYDRRLISAGNIFHLDGTGREDEYQFVAASIWEPLNPGLYNKLRQNADGTFTLRERDGTLYHYEGFSASVIPEKRGRLIAIEDRLGNRISFYYNAPSYNLCTAVDTMGRTYRYFWNEYGRLQSVVDYEGREVRYKYDTSLGAGLERLVAARTPRVTGTSTGNDFPDGKTTSYEYNDPNDDFNLTEIWAPGDSAPVIRNSYNINDELSSQAFGGGGAGGTYTYGILTFTPGPGFRTTTVTDRNGINHELVSELEGHVVQEAVLTIPIRPSDPPAFITGHDYNSTGERTLTTLPMGNEIHYAYDEFNTDRFQRGNLVTIARVADQIAAGGRGDGFGGTLVGGPLPDIVADYKYDPLYTQQKLIIGPVAYTCSNSFGPCATDADCGFTPDDICILPDEYVYDYEEDNFAVNGVAAIATDWNINLVGVSSGVTPPAGPSDLNGDGRVDQIFGNPIRLNQRSNLLPTGRQEAIEGGLIQEIVTRYRYNDLGQLIVEIDPEYNVTTHMYHPETDPDGDGTASPPPLEGFCDISLTRCFVEDPDCPPTETCIPRALDPGTGGYLGETILDADPTPHLSASEIGRRDNATNPPPAQIVNNYSYDPVGNLISSSDGAGTITAYEVNQLGQVVSVRRAVCGTPPCLDPDIPDDGFRAEQIYNARDEIESRRVEDFGDLSNTGGMIETNLDYDMLGNVIAMSREVGGGVFATTTFDYDAQENRTAVHFPEGNTHTFQYDERDLLFRLTRGDGSPTPSTQEFTYDRNGNPTLFVDGNLQPWKMVYDGMDRRVAAEIMPGQWYFATVWDADDQVASRMVIDDLDLTVANFRYATDYHYDAMGRVRTVSQNILDSTGAPLFEDADSDGRVDLHKEFDRNGRVTRSYADDAFSVPSFFDIGDIDLDGAGRILHKIDNVGNEVFFEYDQNNNVVRTEEREVDPSGVLTPPPQVFQTLNTFDRLNRLRSTEDNIGQVKTFHYDSRDNMTELIDASNYENRYTYDGLDRRIEIRRDPSGLDIPYVFQYDLNGRAVGMTDPETNTTTYQYDDLGRKIQDTFADGTTIDYVYDGNDNVVQVTDANGTVIDITYDAADRPIQRDAPAFGHTQTYTYDPLNRLIEARDDNGNPFEFNRVNIEYDSLNRIRREETVYAPITGNPGRILNYTYDGNGNRDAAGYPSGVSLQYAYDGLNRLAAAFDVSGITNFSAEYEYIGPERVTVRQHGNGTSKSYLDPAGTAVIGYDGIKRQQRVLHYDASGTALADFEYTYDPAGNITQETRHHDGGVFDAYQYDKAYRLTLFNGDVGGAVPETHEYNLDKVGNWLSRVVNSITLTNTPNNLNEYGEKPDDGIRDDFNDTPIPGPDGQNLSHDPNGNLILEEPSPVSGYPTTYEYDAYNRLVRVVEEQPGPTFVEVARYVYDGLNRRIAKLDFTDGPGTRFVYDGQQIVEEYEVGVASPGVEGPLQTRYFGGIETEIVAMHLVSVGTGKVCVGGPFPGNPCLTNIDCSPGGTCEANLQYLHEDARGSTAMVTDPNSNVVERVTYGPQGEPVFRDPANVPTGAGVSLIGNPFLYTRQFYDPETQFYEKRGAIYAPRFGRHIQRFVPGQLVGPLSALDVPMFFPCPINWLGMNPFWWGKGWFWHPAAWHCGWWAWKPFWWWGGPWAWWGWRPWLWLGMPFFGFWWVIKPWAFWWHLPFPWWGWQAWWPWGGWWGFWPYWGWLGWAHWIPVWGWIGWKAWWPWWGWAGWCGWWPTFGWWGWCGWWPWWNIWWGWHPWWWWGWWTWVPFWWSGYWGWAGWCFWRFCWGWTHWWPWGWWNWVGWFWWWGWFDWNPWWWGGWWSWWSWGWIRGYYWWWGPIGWGPWFCGWWPWWWWGWWGWLVPWGCWFWRVIWLGLWWWPWWWNWMWGWWAWPWWGRFLWWGWWWPWWGWWG